MIINYFPQELLELQGEIPHHPLLLKIIVQCEEQGQDFYIKMAQIAAYCNVALDGYYTDEMMAKIGEICLERLRKRRGIGTVIENVSEEIVKHH